MSYNNYNRGYAEPTMTSADYMTRTYRWMALGLLITFAAAFVTATTPLFYVVNSLYLLFTIAELALVFVLSARVQNMSVGAARGVFLGYALLNGMVNAFADYITHVDPFRKTKTSDFSKFVNVTFNNGLMENFLKVVEANA